MFNFFKTRLRNKIAAVPIVSVAVMSLLILIYFPNNKKKELRGVLSEQVTATTNLLAYGLGVALDSDRFDAIAEGFNVAKGIGTVTYILLYDKKGNYLNGHNPDNVPFDSQYTTIQPEPIVKGNYMEKAASVKFINQSYGTIVIGVSLSSIEANVRSSFFFMLAIGIVLVILSTVASRIFSSRIVKPLLAVQRAMDALGQRDLTQSCSVDTADETAAMASSVNKAIESLRSSVSITSNGTKHIAKAVTSLSAVAEAMAQNSSILSQKSETVGKSITIVNDKIGTIRSASNEVTQNVITLASSIEEMHASLDEVAKNCVNESTITNNASTKAKDAREVMAALGVATKEITSINDVIENIAQQTNLLALNATIEAASAGEAGRGFSVVAQEVKELSRQTAEATSKIANQIENIQQKTDKAITSISEIATVVNEIDTISRTIATAVEEQSATISQIAEIGGRTSSSAEQISTDVAKWAEEISQISSGFKIVDKATAVSTQSASEIRQSVKELRQLSDELTSTVNQFTF